MSVKKVSKICGLKETSVDNAIRKLKKQNLVEYKGTSKEGGYFII